MSDYFSEEVCKAIGNYVYRLIDPRNGETIYVGKGKGNRVFDHAAGTIKADSEHDLLSLKQHRIREIQNAKLEVIHVIHRHEIPEAAVYEVEAALIDAYAGLLNVQSGHGSNSRGPMNHREVVAKYSLPTLEESPPERLVLININSVEDLSNKSAIYDQVRYAWRLSVERARQAEFVLAVLRGVVIGAFIADEWLPATRENFPDLDRATDEAGATRHGFCGRPAGDSIWDRFVGEYGKRVANELMQHVQNPIRYWQI
jgi:hypothetical protein